LGQIQKKAIDGWFPISNHNSPPTEKNSKNEPKNEGELHFEIALKVNLINII